MAANHKSLIYVKPLTNIGEPWHDPTISTKQKKLTT